MLTSEVDASSNTKEPRATQQDTTTMSERSGDIKSLPGFQYRPLDAEKKEIRLLVVQAASRNFNGRLGCEFRHVSLISKPQPEYETISYCWGDESMRGTIFLEGHRMDVPASTEQVIRRMRKRFHDRTIWIDAVCINQTDQSERSSQVSFMGEIYSKTWQNLVWLGPDDGSARDAIRSLEKLLEKEDKRASAPMFTSPNSAAAADRKEPPESVWPIFALYKLTYFSRLWVCQEMALSPVSLCHLGRHTIPLDQILDSVIRLLSRYPDIRFHQRAGQGFDRLLNIWLLVHQQRGYKTEEAAITGWDLLHLQHGYDTQQQGIQKMTLYQLISQASIFDCGRPKDRIYSLLGIMAPTTLDKPEIRALLKPNYDRTDDEVLRDAVNAIILSTGELEFLERAGLAEDQIGPSWMPDFKMVNRLAKPELRSLSKPTQSWEHEILAKAVKESERSSDEIDYLERASLQAQWNQQHTVPVWIPKLSSELPPDRAHPFPQFFRCDATWSSPKRPSLDGQDIISAATIPLGKVEFMSSPFRAATFNDYNELLGTMEEFTERHEVEHGVFSLDIQTAMSWVLIGGAANHSDPASEADIAAYYEFMDWVLMGVYAERSADVVAALAQPSVAVRRYLLSMEATATNRRLFCTPNGFVGLGPSLMQNGDVIAILFGSRRPVVLRPVGDKFQFVGLCYVHGAMYGEVIKPFDFGDEVRTEDLVKVVEII